MKTQGQPPESDPILPAKARQFPACTVSVSRLFGCPQPALVPALLIILVLAPLRLVYAEKQEAKPRVQDSAVYQGSLAVDSAKGASLDATLSKGNNRLAMSINHATAGTADFSGFDWEELRELSFGINFTSPGFAAGALGLAGIGRFLFRPAAAGPLILVSNPRPLKVEKPDIAGYRGLILGKDGGLLVLAPRSDPRSLTSGAWFSPLDLPLSAIILAGSQPERTSEDWYQAAQARSDRLWGAASIGLSSRGLLYRLSLSGALAASFGLPGKDAMAARLEALLAIQRLRLEAEASFVSDYWQAPDGTSAVPLRLDMSALYRFHSLELSGACLLVRKNKADKEAESTASGAIRLVNGQRDFSVACKISHIPAQNIPDFTLETRWRLGLPRGRVPRLTFETTWKTSDGQSERFDAQAKLQGGQKLEWSAATGLRYETRGKLLRSDVLVSYPLGRGTLSFGLKTRDWLPLAGIMPEYPLDLTVVWSFSGP